MKKYSYTEVTYNQIFCKHELDSKGVCTKCHLETIDWGREKKYDRKLKLSDVEAVLDKVNIFDIPCDLGVFKLEQLVAQDVNGDSYWPKNFLTLFGQGEPPCSMDDFHYIKNTFRSAVVIVTYTGKQVDYYSKNGLLYNLLTWYKYHDDSDYEFYYDEYGIWRKTAAVLSGLGKVADNKLFFSRKFGFDVKIELMLVDELFEEEDYTYFNGDHQSDMCKTCDPKPCYKGCSILTEKDPETFFNKCMTKYDIMSEKYGECRKCQTSCPESPRIIKENVPMEYINKRYDNSNIEYPFIPHNLPQFSFRLYKRGIK